MNILLFSDVLAMKCKYGSLLQKANKNNVYGINITLPKGRCKALEDISGEIITNKQSLMRDSNSEISKHITEIENPKQNVMSIDEVNDVESGNHAVNCFSTNVESADLFKSLSCRKTGGEFEISDGINKKEPAKYSYRLGKIVRENKLNICLEKYNVEKPYICSVCDDRFSEKTHLSDHIKAIHTNKLNLSCHICTREFAKKSYLNAHLRIHAGEKPFKCELCDFRAGHRYILSQHVKAKHTKEKNFSCHICTVKFVSKCKLTAHLRTHAGEKPYICDLCDYRSLWKHELNQHLKTIHINDFFCHICQLKFEIKRDFIDHISTH